MREQEQKRALSVVVSRYYKLLTLSDDGRH